MKIFVKLLLVSALLFVQAAYAKEIAVLLPITGPLTPFEISELTKDAADELAGQFELKYGLEVDQFVKQVFKDESRKKDCDEANCYRRIAAQYRAEKIVALRIIQVAQSSYIVASHLYDVQTGEMNISDKRKCEPCSIAKLKSICKELTGKMRLAQ